MKQIITQRKFHDINIQEFKEDLQFSQLFSEREGSVDELVEA